MNIWYYMYTCIVKKDVVSFYGHKLAENLFSSVKSLSVCVKININKSF